jgi:hypothetical protein
MSTMTRVAAVALALIVAPYASGYFAVWSAVVLARLAETHDVGNCLFYAISKLYREGGRVVVRRSSHYWLGLHFYHTFDLQTFTEYTRDRTPHRWKIVLFRGYIRTVTSTEER